MHRGHLPVLECRADILSPPPLWQRHCQVHANCQPSSHRGLPCLVSQQNHNCDHHRPHGPSLTNANLCPLKVLLDPVLTLHVGVGAARDVGPQPQTGWDTHRVPAPSNTLSQRETNSLALQTPSSSGRTCHLLVSRKRKPLLTFGTSMCKASNSPAAFEMYRHWTASHPGNLFTGPTKPETTKLISFSQSLIQKLNFLN